MCLDYHGKMRFKDIQEATTRITPKVLSKKLLDLEENQLINRTVKKHQASYSGLCVTERAKKTQPIIIALINFAESHRQKILAK